MHDKDAWGCGFCGGLLTTWEERCEHIALHFEEKRTKWNFTNVILGLLKQSDVSQAWNLMLTQRHGEQQNWPHFTWESKKCNRLRYKLETKWDTRMFDIEKLVQETYDLAEIGSAESNEAEAMESAEANDTTEMVDCKLETFDYPSEQRLQSSHGLPPDNAMMDLDPVDSMPQPTLPSQWPGTTDLSHSTMNTDVSMDAFGGFTANMNVMSSDFAQQPVSQSYQQPGWPNAGFVSTPDLVNFQQPGAFMSYTPQKEVIQVPTSQYASFARPTSQHSSHASFARPTSQHSSHANFGHYPRQSVPPNFLHHTGSTGSRRYIPKLVNIASPGHRIPQQDQPPPPPPKDEHRFSRLSMRRRPSNISQHTVVPNRDLGWNDECNWG
jgi:hypothetical protein